MPPSTSSSVTRSALDSPTCGLLPEELSIFTTITGCFGAAVSAGSPVSGHCPMRLTPSATACPSGPSSAAGVVEGSPLLHAVSASAVAAVAVSRTRART